MSSDTTGVTHRRETMYRGGIPGLIVASIVALVALTNLGQPFAAVGLYAALMGSAAVLQFRSPETLLDERDRRVTAKASDYTLTAFAYSAAVVFPALTLTYGLGLYSWTAFAAGAGSALLAVFGVHFAFTAYLYSRMG